MLTMLAQETDWDTLETEDWFEECLQGLPNPPPSIAFERFTVDLSHKEEGMYADLTAGFNATLDKIGWTGMRAVNIHSSTDKAMGGAAIHPEDRNRTIPDLGFYPKTLPSEHQATGVSWNNMEVVVVVKGPASSQGDAKDSAAQRAPLQSLRHKGQLADYAREVLARQQRLFFFAIAVRGNMSRLVRFDRAGATLSSPFDYIRQPEVIGRFLYRLSRATETQRGLDPSVQPASPSEERRFRSLKDDLPEGHPLKLLLTDASDPHWPVYKVVIDAPFSPSFGTRVGRSDAVSRREFLIGRPIWRGASLVGRATRGYIAIDVATGKIVFIKESWRPDFVGMHTEIETYLRLGEAIAANASLERFNNILTLLGGGDVCVGGGPPQRTLTPSFTSRAPRVHIRLVFLEVCRPLKSFSSIFELHMAIYHALAAHYFAWEYCDILHRDISSGNILICDDPDTKRARGLLADWDLAKPKSELGVVGQRTRAGTWPFISARLLTFPQKPYELADDLESFMHIYNWCAFKYLPHVLSSHRSGVAIQIYMIYDAVTNTPDGPACSLEKLRKVVRGEHFVEFEPDQFPLLQHVLHTLSEYCKLHYHHVQLPYPSPFPPPLGTHAAASIEPSFIKRVQSVSHPVGIVRSRTVPTALSIPPRMLSDESQLTLAQPVDPAKSPLREHLPMIGLFADALDDMAKDKLYHGPCRVLGELKHVFAPSDAGASSNSEGRGSSRGTDSSASDRNSSEDDFVSGQKSQSTGWRRSPRYSPYPENNPRPIFAGPVVPPPQVVSHSLLASRGQSPSRPGRSSTHPFDMPMQPYLNAQPPHSPGSAKGYYSSYPAPAMPGSAAYHPPPGDLATYTSRDVRYTAPPIRTDYQQQLEAAQELLRAARGPSRRQHEDNLSIQEYIRRAHEQGQSIYILNDLEEGQSHLFMPPVMSQQNSTMPQPGEQEASLTGTLEPPTRTTTHSSAAYRDDSRAVNTPHNPSAHASASSGRPALGNWPTAQAHIHASPMASGMNHPAMDPQYYAGSAPQYTAPYGQVQRSAGGSHPSVAPIPTWHDPVAGHETYHAGRQGSHNYSATEQWVQEQEYGPSGSYAPGSSAGNWHHGGGSH